MGEEKKSCFVIGPIGEEGSEEREQADLLFEYLIKKATAPCNYEAIRADHISDPGTITKQIIDNLLNDDLVIADLSRHNPNVFYELAIRHAKGNPVVQLIQKGYKIPFDVAQQRTIVFDLTNPKIVEESIQELVRQIKAVEKDPTKVDTPLSGAIKIMSLERSGDPVEETLAEILSIVKDTSSSIKELKPNKKEVRYIRGALKPPTSFIDSFHPSKSFEGEFARLVRKILNDYDQEKNNYDREQIERALEAAEIVASRIAERDLQHEDDKEDGE